MGLEQTQATWVFFMLTAVRRRLGLTPAAFAGLVRDHGLIGFLFDHYELLHFYDNDYIVDDVLRHIEASESARDGALAAR